MLSDAGPPHGHSKHAATLNAITPLPSLTIRKMAFPDTGKRAVWGEIMILSYRHGRPTLHGIAQAHAPDTLRAAGQHHTRAEVRVEADARRARLRGHRGGGGGGKPGGLEVAARRRPWPTSRASAPGRSPRVAQARRDLWPLGRVRRRAAHHAPSPILRTLRSGHGAGRHPAAAARTRCARPLVSTSTAWPGGIRASPSSLCWRIVSTRPSASRTV